ncbi:ribosomal protein of the PO/L10-like protein [Cryptosporidium canis]|uniref:Ribosomal protein of the PO/L10-like protein n=1 Tax=Cryptosporidium canis TaxID=195482 RepID=A0A9D5DJG2_9CRYT|nr:ribosomal protein of the PO/L10-like protein [Cryptosporidium canis]
MVKSRRVKKVLMTKDLKKKRKDKSEIIDNVHEYIGKFKFVYVVKLKNQRNAALKQLRVRLEPGKVLIGKNKLLQVAFGADSDSESAKNAHKISSFLHGERGLIFTDLTPSELSKVLEDSSTMEFGREGSISDITCVVEPNTDLESMYRNAEFQLRRQFPQLRPAQFELNQGNVVICEEGNPLSRYQYLLLKHLDIPSVKFEVKPIACLHNEELTQFEMSDME